MNALPKYPKPERPSIRVLDAELVGRDGEWWLVVRWRRETDHGVTLTEIVDVTMPEDIDHA